MRTAFYYWRATRRRSRRQVLVVALICGLLGTVALGALAGARRTDTAYGRYLRAINSSDVFVNVPGPVLPVIRQVERLPGVASGAATVGLNANPVVNGKVNDAFLTNGLTGSLDGDGFRQDRPTVLAGRLPRPGATSEIALTAGEARFFHTGVGGHVTYEFYRENLKTNTAVPAGRSTFVVTGIVVIPPALGDQFDDVDAAVLPPAATARYLNGEFQFGWVGLRLTAGSAGIPALQRHLATLANVLDRMFGVPPGAIRLNIRRLDILHHEVQQGIEPQAVALAILAGLAVLALLVLAGQALAQLLERSTPDLAGLRAMGTSRAQAALASGLAGAGAVLVGTALAVAGAVAVSPLAPVGAVREFDPARGVQADPLVLAGGGCVLAAALLAVLSVLAWRSARPPAHIPAARASSVASAAAAAGLPVTAVVGTREALERGAGRRPVPVLATLIGSVVAVMAVAMAVVFGASLAGLVANPARYGWNWTLLMDTQGGYGSWSPAQMDRLVSGQRGVTGWSTFAFTQVPVDGQTVPVLGLTRHLGSVEPPTTSGQPIAGPRQIELGVATLRQLGKRVGDTVTVGTGRARRTLTIVGTVTLPSIGLTIADHVSLGRGAMLADSTLLRIQGLSPSLSVQQAASAAVAVPAFPSAVAIDMAPGASSKALVARISDANPGGTPGGTYRLPQNRIQGAAIVDAARMGSQPLALALAATAGAVLSLALALLASVRRRRRELALLKTLGLTRRQVMAAVAWQASVILVIAALAGVPLGVAAGHWAWDAFATSLGAVPVTVVPVPALLAGFFILLVAGNLLAAGPGAVAARTPPAAVLRAE
ncbi:MAG TPA: ABC transporter permease [Streptosporangiaceae bacterium]|nr:ABC transporter permease [Streptosporangiaceae bacterium]